MNEILSRVKKILNGHTLMMLVCCAAMFAGLYFFVKSDLGSGSWGLLLPLLICVGMHFIMHRMMGSNCHDKEGGGEAEGQTNIEPRITESISSHNKQNFPINQPNPNRQKLSSGT